MSIHSEQPVSFKREPIHPRLGYTPCTPFNLSFSVMSLRLMGMMAEKVEIMSDPWK